MKNKFKNFNLFLQKYDFNYRELEMIDDKMFWNRTLIHSDDEVVAFGEDFINVGYKLKGAHSKALSNLFPYEFIFKGKKIKSIESVFQGLKFQNKKTQNLVLKYSGLDSNNIKIASDYDWKTTGILYWQGKPINRYSEEYDNFIAELYFSAIKNPLYKQILKSIKGKYIFHTMGEVDKSKTVFTRFEFERMLNALVSYING